MKPAIGAGTVDPPPAIAKPAGIRIGKTIECGHIGFDIRERGALCAIPDKDLVITAPAAGRRNGAGKYPEGTLAKKEDFPG